MNDEKGNRTSKLLVLTVLLLLAVVSVQGLFLLKLYRQTSSGGNPDDRNPLKEMQRMSRLFDDSFNRLRQSPAFGQHGEESVFSPELDLTEENRS